MPVVVKRSCKWFKTHRVFWGSTKLAKLMRPELHMWAEVGSLRLVHGWWRGLEWGSAHQDIQYWIWQILSWGVWIGNTRRWRQKEHLLWGLERSQKQKLWSSRSHRHAQVGRWREVSSSWRQRRSRETKRIAEFTRATWGRCNVPVPVLSQQRPSTIFWSSLVPVFTNRKYSKVLVRHQLLRLTQTRYKSWL